MSESIGQRIKRLRTSTGLKQIDLAKSCGVSINMVSKWENDKGKPSRVNVGQIAKTLNISPAFLSYGDEFIDTDEAQSITVKFDLLNNKNKQLIEVLIKTMIKQQRENDQLGDCSN